jgi:hypothetical protein
MSKYQPLTEYLKNVPFSQYQLNFKDIENIIKDRLPASAYQYRAWWSNNPSNSAMTKAWLDAGWISSDVNLQGQRLVFRRKPRAPASFPQPVGEDSLIIKNLTPETMANLKAIAQLKGMSVMQAALDILNAHSKLTVAERLSLADKIRAKNSKMHHIDVPGMIRADRDSR